MSRAFPPPAAASESSRTPPGFPAQGDAAVRVTALGHRYGERVALDDVSFAVASGEIFGVLGPNGGGKSTLFRILSTLMPPTAGSVRILGHDPVRDRTAARRQLGVVFQAPALDRMLTVRENLLHHGHLYGLRGATLSARIEGAAELLGLRDRLQDRSGELSGGMRRRVEIAKALLPRPRLLLLDEPTTGLDPGARRDVWSHLHELRRTAGLTLLFTTHLMDEADACSRILILDRGRAVGLDAPDALKAEIRGDVITVETSEPDSLAARVRADLGIETETVGSTVRAESEEGAALAARLIERYRAEIRSVTVGRPTLEDVFLSRTGHRFETEAAE